MQHEKHLITAIDPLQWYRHVHDLRGTGGGSEVKKSYIHNTELF
jgi:hypothetical protein